MNWRLIACALAALTLALPVFTLGLSDADAKPAKGVNADLAAAVRGLPPEMALYKSIPPFRAALLAYLDARST